MAAYTRVKFVFDFDPRAQDRAEIVAELGRGCGLCARSSCGLFFLQAAAGRRAGLWLRVALEALEHSGPLARAALHVRGIWFCAAYPGLAGLSGLAAAVGR